MGILWGVLQRLAEHRVVLAWLIAVMVLSSVPIIISWWIERRRFRKMRETLRLEVDVEQRRARDLLRGAEERRERERIAAEVAQAEKKAYEEKISEYERLVRDPDALSIALQKTGGHPVAASDATDAPDAAPDSEPVGDTERPSDT